MQPKPISIQLYTLREASQQDFVGVLNRLAQIGFKGVEPAGLYGLSPKEFRGIVNDLGMAVSSAHGISPQNMPVQQAIDEAGVLGLDILCGGYGPPEFNTLDAIKQTAEKVTGMIDALAPAGLQLMLHNHYWEFEQVEGRLAYDWFAELCPKALFEIDTYWASNFGANDPAEQVAKFKARTPYLHIKDGPLVKDEPMLAAGTGKMNFPAVINAADENVLRWLVIELDACATDMFTAVEESYRYLVDNNLGLGNR
ncbi:MAG TPA: sugar phosphate isomerase/epimerase [Armatimonadota bacterium]|jgi:sugar phosphate isomerase/epimerase